MKRSTILLSSLLFLLLSCGTTSQYSQQRFQDGIYVQESQEQVTLLTKEDFERRAAENLYIQSLGAMSDSTNINVNVINVYPGDYYYDMYFSPFPRIALFATDIAFSTWYWDRWHLWWGPYGPAGPYDLYWFNRNMFWFDWGWSSFGWYDPWMYGPAWHNPWYNPWYNPWHSPWYGPGYGPFYPSHGHGPRPGHSNSWYGPRSWTQPTPGHSHRGPSGSHSSYSPSGTRVPSSSSSGTRPNAGQRRDEAIDSNRDRSLSDGYNRRSLPSNSSSSSGSNSRSNNSRSYDSNSSRSGSSTRSYDSNSSRSSSSSSRSYDNSSSRSSSSSYQRSNGGNSSSRSYSGGSSSRSSYGGGSHTGGGARGGRR